MFALGARSPAVVEVRDRLVRLGLLHPAPERDAELFDGAVDRAVRLFQQRRGLEVDGKVGPATFRRLEEARWSLGDRVLSYRAGRSVSGDDVAALQRRLLQLGFDVDRVDGIFGVRTDAALREFQRSVGVPVDGICGPESFRALGRLARTVSGGGNQLDLREQNQLEAVTTGVADKVVVLDAAKLPPIVTWGTSPEDVISITGVVPDPDKIEDEAKRISKHRALDYMGLKAGTKITDIKLDRVFIGSCTNGRIEDLRAVAAVAKGRKVNPRVNAMIVPGSGLVKAQAEAEGLDRIFVEAGFDWREPGCSMCLAMNDDRLKPHERCASTSNRNFEGRQGFKGRTHLVSPAMAAAAAIAGHFVDIRDWK